MNANSKPHQGIYWRNLTADKREEQEEEIAGLRDEAERVAERVAEEVRELAGEVPF